MAVRSYPTSEVRGCGREELPKSEVKGGGQEELPHFRGQGQWPRVPGYEGTGTAERSYPASEVGGAAGRSYSTSKEPWLCRRRRA